MVPAHQQFLPICARSPRQRNRAAASWVLFAPLLFLLIVAIPAQAETDSPRGKVLLVRGVLTVFSLGLDELAQKLPGEDLDVQVVTASMSGVAVRQIGQQYARGELRGPLVLIGHSLGGDLLPSLAQQLGDVGQTVDLMVMIDSTNPSDAPKNVRRCVNLYQSNFSPAWFRVFRGAPIRAANPATQLVNVDIRQLPEQDEAAKLNHFNIEASKWIHEMVLREVEYAVKSRGQ
jgi:alpha-beta hydrolase superfamily lysophospholipase